MPLVLASGQPGKEILYPVATVILGGLLSSTLLDFFVRPALFWTFGRKAAEWAVKHHHHEPDLKEASPPSESPHYASTRPDDGAGGRHAKAVHA